MGYAAVYFGNNTNAARAASLGVGDLLSILSHARIGPNTPGVMIRLDDVHTMAVDAADAAVLCDQLRVASRV